MGSEQTTYTFITCWRNAAAAAGHNAVTVLKQNVYVHSITKRSMEYQQQKAEDTLKIGLQSY